jgi:hypothetical protein
MADINQVITLGVGTPSGILEFLTFGLQIAQITQPLILFFGNMDLPIRAAITIEDLPIRAAMALSLDLTPP